MGSPSLKNEKLYFQLKGIVKNCKTVAVLRKKSFFSWRTTKREGGGGKPLLQLSKKTPYKRIKVNLKVGKKEKKLLKSVSGYSKTKNRKKSGMDH